MRSSAINLEKVSEFLMGTLVLKKFLSAYKVSLFLDVLRVQNTTAEFLERVYDLSMQSGQVP